MRFGEFGPLGPLGVVYGSPIRVLFRGLKSLMSQSKFTPMVGLFIASPCIAHYLSHHFKVILVTCSILPTNNADGLAGIPVEPAGPAASETDICFKMLEEFLLYHL